MRKTLPALVVLVLTFSGVNAAWEPLTGDPVSLDSLIDEGLTVGDKIFCEFDLFGTAFGGAIAPDLSSIHVQGGWDDATGDYGLRFLMSWNAASGQIVNTNLSFTVAIIDDPQWEHWQIKDVGLMLSGASATETGVVSASETVWDGPVPSGEVLASLSASKQELDGGTQLTDWAEFDPVKAIWVRKDISITGGAGLDGSAHLSEMFQFFSQVPEPTSMTLLALGALGLLKARRNRHC